MDTGNEHVPQAARILDFSDPIQNTTNGDQPEEVHDKEKLVHTNVPENMIPEIGMEFESDEAAYNFYNNYAAKVGFSIKILGGHREAGALKDRFFSCSCHGTRGKDKRREIVKRRRAETRFGCPAVLKLTARHTGKLRVYKFVAEHSHGLATPKKCHMLRSHRKIKDIDKAQLDMAESVGIALKQSMDLLAVQSGGRENVGFIPEDYRNYLRSKRTVEMKPGDTGGVLEYLQKMQDEDANFSCAIQVDRDDQITNIFWSDAKMKLDFGYFGDVVCFDTTYRKNKEGRPLALFVGVNHHKQSVLFGGALLYDETAETFKWLFRTFANVMSDKKPKTILTDECQAMAKALASSWPDTTHRLCVWHIYQNAAKHLSGVFTCHRSFVKDFGSCIYDYDEVPDFIDAWEKMLVKYELQKNEWLNKLFEKKEQWALVYGRQTFCADMSTTQRSESMNSQVKRYIDYKHDLLRFFQHFQRLVEDRRYDELRADFRASQSSPPLVYPAEIFSQAAQIYTPAVFMIFEQELWKTFDCVIEVCNARGTISEYKVRLRDKPYEHMVTFDSSNCNITCSCKKFEFSGILCAHALRVFSYNNVQRIPEDYILKRWTKDAKAGGIITASSSNVLDDPKLSMRKRFKELSYWFNQLSGKAAESGETYDIAKEGCRKIIEEVEVKLRSLKISSTKQSDGDMRERPAECIGRATICGGIRVKGLKPKPKAVRSGGKRIKGALEKAFASKRPRMQKKACSRKSDQEQTNVSSAHETYPRAEELHHVIDLNMEPKLD